MVMSLVGLSAPSPRSILTAGMPRKINEERGQAGQSVVLDSFARGPARKFAGALCVPQNTG